MSFALIDKEEVHSLGETLSLMSFLPLLPSEACRWFRNHLHPDLWYREYKTEQLTLIPRKIRFFKVNFLSSLAYFFHGLKCGQEPHSQETPFRFRRDKLL